MVATPTFRRRTSSFSTKNSFSSSSSSFIKPPATGHHRWSGAKKTFFIFFLQNIQLYNYKSKTEDGWQTHRLFRPEVSWPYPEPFWKAGLAPPLWPPREPPRVNTGGGIWPPCGSLKRGAGRKLDSAGIGSPASAPDS